MKLMIFGLIVLSLNSCAIYNTDFECKLGMGQKCTSVSKINKMVDLGLITNDEKVPKEEIKQKPVAKKPKPRKQKIKQKKGVDIWIAGNSKEGEKFI